MKIFNVKTLLCTAVFSTFLAACGGGVSDKVDTSINLAEKNRSSTFKFINATNDMVNFHIQAKGISETIYASKYKVASILEGSVSESYAYNWNKHFSRSEFGIIDSVSLTKKDTVKHTIENNKAYWGIAWLDKNEYSITIVDFSSHTNSDSYAVRFFSMSDQDIFLGDNTTPVFKAVKGEVTPTFTFNNCIDLVVINDNPSDFCQIATAGEHYIAVIGLDGEVTLALQ